MSFYKKNILLFVLGLLIAQIISSLFIYRNSLILHRQLNILHQDGYLIVPNLNICDSLTRFSAACQGGVFFLMTIGIGLSFVSLIFILICFNAKTLKISGITSSLVIWIFFIVWMNWDGFNGFATVLFVAIPAIMVLLSLKLKPRMNKFKIRDPLFYVLPILILAGVWGAQLDKNMFVDIRDVFLLSNPIGAKINNFYYKYNLYAANLFQNLDQKLIKTVNIESVPNTKKKALIQDKLLSHDYLPIQTRIDCDLVLKIDREYLQFFRRGRHVMAVTMDDFLDHTEKVLKTCSKKSDTYKALRRFTFFSLLFGFPIFLYGAAHRVIFAMISLWCKNKKYQVLIASIVCLICGGGATIYFVLTQPENIRIKDVSALLNSDEVQDRVTALKKIRMEKLEIEDYDYQNSLAADSSVPERYWLLKALAISRKSENLSRILKSIDDPNNNIKCMAFYAIGVRGDKTLIPKIIKSLKNSKDWYSQWYGYKALKRLGWVQSSFH